MEKNKTEKKMSILIQRLKSPYKKDGDLEKLGASLAFGGGAKNGGISDDAMEVIGQIFSFDYMGACEFEHGAVATAMDKILNNRKKYIRVIFEASTKDGHKKMVYVICHKDIEREVVKWIRTKANDEWDGGHTHETVGLERSINSDDDDPTIGWLELDNGFFFFIDEEMFNKTNIAFRIK